MIDTNQRTTIDVCGPACGEVFTCTTEMPPSKFDQHFNWEDLTPRVRDLLTTLNEMFNTTLRTEH